MSGPAHDLRFFAITEVVVGEARREGQAMKCDDRCLRAQLARKMMLCAYDCGRFGARFALSIDDS